MKKMRIVSIMLVFVLLSSMTVSIYGAEAASWSDKAIENAVANGLFNSSTAKSLANVDLSRAELAAVINRAFGGTTKASLDKFTDVSKEAWYYDDMAKAVNMGIFNGSNGKLSPKSKITREEAFAVLARAIKLPGTDPSFLGKFSDAKDISSWAKPEVAAMVKAGYINGSGLVLNPKGLITRAQFAQIMDNLVKGYIKAAGTYTSVPGGNILINTPGVTLKGVTVTGDLIIGDGVGNGEVTLDSVKVTGRTVVRGGGVNSIKIIGGSSMASVVVCRVDGQVRVFVSGDSNVQVVVIDDGSDDVSVEGTIGSVVVNAAGITVTANKAKIGTVSIEAEGADFAVGAGSSVDKLTLNASGVRAAIAGTVKSIEAARTAGNAAITTAGTGKIDSIKTEAAGTTVTGTGTVTRVEANANNVRVDTPNTSVSAGAGTTGITAGGTAVGAGSTGNTTPPPPVTTTTTTTGSNDNNNNNNNTGGPSTGIPDVAIDYTNECIKGYNSSTMEYSFGDDFFPGMGVSVLEMGNTFKEMAERDDSDIWHSDVDWSAAGSLKSRINDPFPTGILCRYKATGSTQASGHKALSLIGRSAAPAGLAAVSATQGSNGKITLLTSADYQYKLFNADSWSNENIVKTASAETYEIGSLAAGTYYVRAKATASSFASWTTTLTVFAGGSTEPAAPKLLYASFNTGSTKITLKFDKAMNTTGLEVSDFTVSGGSWEFYGPYQIASVGLKQGDNTSIELTLSKAPNYYPVRVAYKAGTAVAADGGALAAFSGKNPDNMYLQLTLESGDEQPYGSITLDSIGGSNYNNKVAFAIADDNSTAIPAAGTSIWDKTDIRVMDQWYFPIHHANIAADKYLVLYTFDQATGIITGFGQEKIDAEDIGKACTMSESKFQNATEYGVNGTANYVISFGSIGENQTVTIAGADADDVSQVAVPSTTPAYAVYTADIATSGGIKTFTLTLSGDATNGQTNGTYTITIKINTPSPYLMVDPIDKHKLNVTRARPGSEIVLYYSGNSYVYKTATADSNGNASFDDCEVHSEYYVWSNGPETGLSSYQSNYVDITE